MKAHLLTAVLIIGSMGLGLKSTSTMAQTIVYVKADGTGDGTSWANACNLDDIFGRKGAHPITSPNTEVWVQKGTHTPSQMLTIPANVKMYGSFNGTESSLGARSVVDHSTVIDAQQKYGSVVHLGEFALLDGFTIKNGSAQWNPRRNGGGVYAEDSSTVANCFIIDNATAAHGGGVYAREVVFISNTTIENNTAAVEGNEIYGCCMLIDGGSTTVPFICKHPSTVAETRTQTFETFSPLTVSVVGSGKFSYKWYSNTTNSVVGGTAVGTDTNVYVPLSDNISNLYYYVVVTNDFGSDTSAVSGLRTTIAPVINFDYTGTAKEITLTPGTYIMECWGARGGGTYTGNGGAGGDTYGQIELYHNTTLYVYVGQYVNTVNLPTWNGGSSSGSGHPGGGASDIRITSGAWNEIKSLRSRIMVAAGGGGATPSGFSNYSRHGGGLVGGDASQYTQGGTQTGSVSSYGENGGFGRNSNGGASGGNGYYGGAGASHVYGGGAGGSSFISGHPGCNAIRDAESTVHTGQPNHYSRLVFSKTKMIAGNASMPNPRGTGNMTGNAGHGYVRITRVK